MDVRLPNGTILHNVPDGTTQDQIAERLRAAGVDVQAALGPAKEPESRKVGGVADLVAGAVRGAGSIGATLLAPVDAAVRATGADNSVFGPNGLFLGRTDRRQAMTDALDQLGADTKSYAFGAGKLGSEVAGTLGVGGGLGRLAAPIAGERVAAALASSGLSTGAGQAGKGAASALSDLLLRTGAGAASGGASAALVDPQSTGTGAVIGAALPPALMALGAGGKMLGNTVSGVRAAVSDSGAKAAALRNIEQAIGRDAAVTLPSSMQSVVSPGGIPLSAAARSGSNDLALLEQASRLRAPAAWRDFDTAQAQAVWNKVQQAGSAAGDLGAARAARSQNWQDRWRSAASAFEPGATTTPSQLRAAMEWPADVQKLSAQLDQALKSPQAANDTVERMLTSIKGKIDRFGDGFSPAHLQQIRASLSGKAWEGSADPLKQVPRDNPATLSVLRAVDDMLNKATGGRWQNVTSGYAADSQAVDAARGAGRMMSTFVSPEGNLLGRTVASGTLPEITAPRLERSMNLARGADRSLPLDAGAQSALNDALAALKAQQIVQQVKRSASAGGGSDSIPNLMSLAGTSQPGILRELMQMGRHLAKGRTEAQMAGLLSSPEGLAAAMSARNVEPGLLSGLLDGSLLFGVRAAPGAAASR